MFLGSAIIEFLYDRSRPTMIVVSVILALAAVPFFQVSRRLEPTSPLPKAK
jgi:hypothetical protein